MYREVRMVEITEVLACGGLACRRSASPRAWDWIRRRYVAVAEGTGLRVGKDALSDTQLRDVLLALHAGGGRPEATTGTDVARRPTRFATGCSASCGWRRFGNCWPAKASNCPIRRSTGLPSWSSDSAFRAHDAGRRCRGGRGAGARHGVGRVADADRAVAPIPRLDLHGRRLASPIRVSDIRGNNGAHDRSLRSRLDILRRRLQSQSWPTVSTARSTRP